MKRLFFCLALTIPLLSFSQKSKTQIPKKANTIIVSGVSFDNAVQTLITSGYIIDNVNKDYKVVSTKKKGIGGGELIMQVFGVDSTVSITGLYSSSVGMFGAKLEGSPVEWSGMSGNDFKRCFSMMDKYAQKLGGTITYEKR